MSNAAYRKRRSIANEYQDPLQAQFFLVGLFIWKCARSLVALPDVAVSLVSQLAILWVVAVVHVKCHLASTVLRCPCVRKEKIDVGSCRVLVPIISQWSETETLGVRVFHL